MQVLRARHLLAATAIVSLLLPYGAVAAPPSSAEKRADREALRTALLEVLQRAPLKVSRVGVHMQSLDDGTVVFTHNADELLNPASNVKLVTSAAALATLGPEFRYDTEFLVEPELPADGKVKTLYVRGKGDPSITTERLWGVVSELWHSGLREVGDIVVDDSWFDAERTPPGYDQEDSDRAYMAPTGALSLNWNAVAIFLRPGASPGAKGTVEMEPPSDYFIVDNQLSTGARRARRVSVTSDPSGAQQKIVVRGQVPAERGGAVSVWKKIDNPPMYFGQTLKQLLSTRGMKVKGRVKVGLTPSKARTVHVAQSDTFDVLLKRLNKLSSNFVAEQLLKTMGAEGRGQPGSFTKGVEVVEQFLERDVGISRGTYVMKNGSGLNDANRFSAAQLNKLLRHMSIRFPFAPEYLSSVPIAGKDGTLKYRFEGSDAVGKLRAKTGTLEGVSALSGYVTSAGGERFSFSMMVNDFAGRAGPIVAGLDALGAAVAATGSSLGPSSAVASLADGGKPSGAIDDVAARIKTYLDLGRQRDQRNLGFLRTAWRSERDPAVRAVLAESLYQSNPHDYLGARTLLDSYSAGNDVYGRLREVARVLSVEVPGVTSMVELAAGGNTEALARVLELAGATGVDAQAQAEMSVALGEVARTAPEELVVALRASSPADREAASTLLARALVQAGQADHPFWKSLRRLQGAADPQVAAFSKGLDSTLSQKVAEAKAPRPSEGGAPVQVVAPAGGASSPTPPRSTGSAPDASRTAETRPGG
ncbi:D-alanyl-D-alanine carboxypeptidase/D-alanyl-D-alanine-endopeptidase [Myxococcus sp. CA051A]|uniref:D-alanyl-D-alanine carboxypeptidase/D-alanyl-D-alanine-endopeptidase n=1 Tax=Myxococcus llanfairpwllgwyngyllgogerychwyrndrobwllllantysiliogogogochensis TaxID=2590453 RepID=A0A540WUN7_9BACT|nr:D-alanyl-D-alanine carboxypeptidase/D-alanyl-D-alanine-endopeptidase [Myxococcus llanfairpwllgwyngyllgogerychwyrndrobwllllantysiliogogogochensis]NTX06071.1 D-alanyl-D-alanine carboxypeptidase/D-alanyl-D-alanine-endopeptidase [Myxococcus sp. CA040A]NTX09330.1 D-alanyl-D-alanine carboxypeptidase/D-alanyl-D-alanine-endopeptidase [Myxococcus sp. CA056]NTX37692.1 D-alanyl-D-alanine carboxypeptidase/D-alanyl-D-alanine-endopeptidase [Myxococcus sp. CA033]NTX53257.1 D-alanyl-D-alanine carboxypeptida